jgi:alanyl-tRNA synthetase
MAGSAEAPVTEFLTGNETRKMFLRFFEERGHRVVRSSSLVPANDPTLLFTNAGMNQFKDVFLGLEQRDYTRATTCQKCVRAGGKHNDLENVGFTNRHHTFFEMLGNFSFGDYFKEQAIAYAMELITSPDWFAIPLEKLYFTVFGGAEVSGTTLPTDTEAAAFWAKVGAPRDRIIAVPGLKENFWAMGDTGPCGPCSEIFYDMGPAASDQGHTDCQFGCDCGRYMEIWNLVFMQFNRYCEGMGFAQGSGEIALHLRGVPQPDSKHQHGPECLRLRPLPKPSVDTGMGLERLAATLLNIQDPSKVSNYDTDLFQPLIEGAERLTGIERFFEGAIDEENEISLRIIADHSRAATFLISDGVTPSNEGRGFVLRKIITRGLLNAGKPETSLLPVLPGMARTIAEQMKDVYPELHQNIEQISSALKAETSRYIRRMKTGIERLREEIGDLWQKERDILESKKSLVIGRHILPGDIAFKMYDTYGLPREVIAEATRLQGFEEVDWTAFDQAMKEQRERGRASWKGAHKEAASPVYLKLKELFKTEPDFYFGTQTRDARIEGIVTKQGAVNQIKAGDEAEIVLDRTSIYSESGGQVADTGAFYDNDMSLQLAEVKGAYYPVSGLIAHRIVAKENLQVGDRVATVADPVRRARDMRNHTATHLMHSALRNILGTHVKQAGSLVAPDHLRFDFSHFASVDASELAEIEQQVNEEILRNLALETDIMNIDDALASGALAFFGDKYPESNVRVVTIPDPSSPRGFYSKELCGGTHVSRTGEIGVFKITGEQSIAAGVRRIEAISGDYALAEYQRTLNTLRSVSQLLNAGEGDVIAALERQLESTKQLEKQLEALKHKAAGSTADSLLEEARTIKDVRVLAAKVSGFDRDALRQMVDTLRQKLGSGVVVLFSTEDGKVALITGVTKDLTPRLHAGKIVQELAKQVGGSGGGRPDLAEAGGKDTSAVESALSTVYPLIERLLNS